MGVGNERDDLREAALEVEGDQDVVRQSQNLIDRGVAKHDALMGKGLTLTCGGSSQMTGARGRLTVRDRL